MVHCSNFNDFHENQLTNVQLWLSGLSVKIISTGRAKCIFNRHTCPLRSDAPASFPHGGARLRVGKFYPWTVKTPV